MQSKRELYVRGKLHFSRTKVLLQDGENEYFIKPFSLERGYLEWDMVEAKVIRSKSEWYLAEGLIKKLISRTRIPVIGTITSIQGRKMQADIFQEYGNIGRIMLFSGEGKESLDDVVELVYESVKKIWVIKDILGKSSDPKIDEMLLFRKEWVRVKFSETVIEEAEKISRGLLENSTVKSLIPSYITHNLDPKYFDPGIPEYFPSILSKVASTDVGKQTTLRTDFRKGFTMTIDGADAKDLDDAISIARYRDGSYLLAVHIADVAEYVREWSALDHEAIERTTSIYTPGQVIPMLPEKLSNDLCSLHPGEPKLTLSILMKVDQKGNVLGTFMTEGVIESRKRGIYEEIEENGEWWMMNDEWNLDIGGFGIDQKPWNGGSGGETVWAKKKTGNKWAERGGASFLPPEAFDTFGSKSMEMISWIVQNDSEWLDYLSSVEWRNLKIPFLEDFFSLFHILEKRRKKEGKIIFESWEPTFSFDSDGQIIDIQKRERGASHMMIEEFMVLTNEEVAKWCTKYSLPFLSRIHHLPPEANAKIIREIVGLASVHETIHPSHIRSYLDTLSTTESLYRLSRLLLPKMAKAFYSDTSHMHFGLALEYYAHFTSPIRRYPDLQVHRIIKEELHKSLDKTRKDHYRHILKKIAKKCSDGEVRATDIERAVDAIIICRYMTDKVGETFEGRISGLTEWAIFVELENGVEVTVYQPRGWVRSIIDPVTGTLSRGNRVIYTIGDPLRVKVIGINTVEKRVEGEILI